jgi:alkaline phosphatase D
MMRRRNFLRATLVSAGAILVGTGCGPDDANNGDTGRTVTPGEAYFPQSVASGDPKPDSVILWARVEDEARAGEDLPLEVEVALDEAFTSLVSINGQERLTITATAAFDNCVKVKVKGLSPGTVYYYRFIYSSGGKLYASRTGRTKTAPAPDADAVVRFAFVSCQDFNGRYYNSHLELANQDVDFVVHLGDYIYETTGDPSFQDPTAERGVKFSDAAGAISFGAQAGTYYAAKSLSNYRELYKIYRGDAQLQRVHELFPVIVIWDDHEYSNDCHGAVAAYYNDTKDELDEARRKNANQAWFEYMPVDFADEGFVYDQAAEYKSDIKINRDFTFGKHVHLVMTDLRTHRADHIIPEGAYPGAVALDQATLTGLGLMPSFGFPYVDIDAATYADYKKLLTDAAMAGGYDPANIKGNISVDYINGVIAKAMAPLAPIDDPMAERGLAFLHLGKMSPNSSLGSRYLVIKDTFDLYAAAKFSETKGASEVVMGDEQEAWFLSTMTGSKSTWKIWGNEYCLIPFQVDLTQLDVPALFKQRFYFNVDAWDGFRNKRSELLGKLSAVSNVVAVTGDIHAFYAGLPNVNNDLSKHIVEFVGGSISSSTFREELLSQISSDPGLSTIVGLDQLAKAVDDLMLSTDTKVNPHLAYAKSDKNGFVVVEVSASEVVATYHMIPSNDVKVDYSKEGGITAKVSTERFKTVAGEGSLYREIDGAWKRWDTATLTWM